MTADPRDRPSGPAARPPFETQAWTGDPAGRGGIGPMNKVLLTGRLTRDTELRALASGKNVTTFSVAAHRATRVTSRRTPLGIGGRPDQTRPARGGL